MELDAFDDESCNPTIGRKCREILWQKSECLGRSRPLCSKSANGHLTNSPLYSVCHICVNLSHSKCNICKLSKDNNLFFNRYPDNPSNSWYHYIRADCVTCLLLRRLTVIGTEWMQTTWRFRRMMIFLRIPSAMWHVTACLWERGIFTVVQKVYQHVSDFEGPYAWICSQHFQTESLGLGDINIRLNRFNKQCLLVRLCGIPTNMQINLPTLCLEML